MAWPTVAELKQRLDVTSDDWDSQLARLLAGAVDVTKARVGDWVEDYDEPDEAQSQSALELAVELAQNGTPEPGPTKSKALLFGKRRRFGIG